MDRYIVQLSRQVLAEITLYVYIARVTSYRKGLDGLILTPDETKAHRYTSERNALKPAQAYNGVVKLV